MNPPEEGESITALFRNFRMPLSPHKDPAIGWLLINEGVVEDAGKGDPPDHKIPRGVDLLDGGGAPLLPGMYDAHMHLYQWSISRKATDLSDSHSIKDLTRRLKMSEKNEGDPFMEGGGILFGVDYDESRFTKEKNITGNHLDSVFPDIPVMIRRVCGHRVLLNRSASDHLDIEHPVNGILEENEAMRISWKIPLRSSYLKDILDEGMGAALSMGVIGGTDIVPGSELEDVIDSYQYSKRYMDISLSVHFEGEPFLSGPIRDMKNWDEPFKDLAGAEKTTVVFSKYFVDGSIGARTASFSRPYRDSGKEPPLVDDRELADEMEICRKAGLIPMIHAIGDEAVSTVMRAYRMTNCPFRLEHAECVSDRDLDTMRDGGVAVCMQPNFQLNWGGDGGLYQQALGKERYQLNRFRDICNASPHLGFGSDMMPLGPLRGIRGATSHQNPKQSITWKQAVKAYSMDAARISLPKKMDPSFPVIGKKAEIMIPDRERSGSVLTVSKGVLASMDEKALSLFLAA